MNTTIRRTYISILSFVQLHFSCFSIFKAQIVLMLMHALYAGHPVDIRIRASCRYDVINLLGRPLTAARESRARFAFAGPTYLPVFSRISMPRLRTRRFSRAIQASRGRAYGPLMEFREIATEIRPRSEEDLSGRPKESDNPTSVPVPP